MIFALGFLVASLCALLLLPAVSARAARLARRRVEAMFPLSIAEIVAEKDSLRADFAVAQRRLERKVEEARSKRHADMEAVGERTLQIAALSREIEASDAVLREREAEIATALATLAGLERDLGTARTDGALSLATLHALEEAHREILDDLTTARRERDTGRVDLATALDRTRIPDAVNDEAGAGMPNIEASSLPDRNVQADEAAHTASDLADLRAQHAALVTEREALRESLKAAEDALAQGLAERRDHAEQDNAELRSRITEVADAVIRRERLPTVGTFPASATS